MGTLSQEPSYTQEPDTDPLPVSQSPALSEPQKPYLGSVLFFKHIIFVLVLLLIVIPTTMSVCMARRVRTLQGELTALRTQITEQETLSAAEAATAPAPEEPPETTGPELPGYAALYPDLYAPDVERNSVDIDHSVYLTFDDGPSERTDDILKILDKYGVKATFFVIGVSDEQQLQRMRDIVAAGHSLGIHSFLHEYRTIYGSVEAYLDDFNAMYCQILEATGTAPQIFRFPGGSVNGYNQSIYREIIAEMTRRGFVYFDWNVINGDTTTNHLLPAGTLTANALKGVGTTRRAVILMHDSRAKTTTVDALPAIIEGYQKAGYTFAALTPETRPVTFGYSS